MDAGKESPEHDPHSLVILDVIHIGHNFGDPPKLGHNLKEGAKKWTTKKLFLWGGFNPFFFWLSCVTLNPSPSCLCSRIPGSWTGKRWGATSLPLAPRSSPELLHLGGTWPPPAAATELGQEPPRD